MTPLTALLCVGEPMGGSSLGDPGSRDLGSGGLHWVPSAFRADSHRVSLPVLNVGARTPREAGEPRTPLPQGQSLTTGIGGSSSGVRQGILGSFAERWDWGENVRDQPLLPSSDTPQTYPLGSARLCDPLGTPCESLVSGDPRG